MKTVVTFIALFFLACTFASAQRTLTKAEILQYYKTIQAKKRLPKDSIILTWSNDLNIKLRYRIDSLKSSGIDSFIVYSVSYPGYGYKIAGKIDSCSSPYSTSAFLIWKEQGKTVIEKFNGKCQTIVGNDVLTELFSFYDKHSAELKDEMFMPVIYGGQIYDDGKMTYKVSVTDHEPKYSLYYDIGADHNFFSFAESEITNKEGIFYQYDLDLSAYHWWELILKQVSDKGGN